jgi:steroid delta-isomerase-like uncharacterized protein
MADNATLARSFYENWNTREFEKTTKSFASDSTVVIVGSGQTFHGPKGMMEFETLWADAFPDGSVTIDTVVAHGDHVVVEYTGRGTHTGTLRTPMGDLPATGRSLTLQLVDILEFDGGTVRSQRTYFDTGSMMAQLGISATQAATQQ